MGTFSYNTGPCVVCGKRMTNAGFAVKAHMAMHKRSGELVTLYKWSWKGVELASRDVPPAQIAEWEARGYFASFDRCREVVGGK